ncbi:hypothetical protein GC169_11000 [bacterium]|nr:hypothetical protein [bacterium]
MKRIAAALLLGLCSTVAGGCMSFAQDVYDSAALKACRDETFGDERRACERRVRENSDQKHRERRDESGT